MREIESLGRNNMNHICRVGLVLGLLIAVAPKIYAEDPGIPKALNALVMEGIDLTLRQEYTRADSVVRMAVELYPRNPLGYLYRAGVMEARSMDYLDPLNFTKFDSLLSLASNEAKKIIEEHPRSALGHYYLGTAIGYDAYAQVDAGNWLGGILKGLSAASEFKKTIELDSSLYDAYVGVGTYYYWKSRKIEFLNWMLGDHRAEGIRLLETAVDRAEYNKFTALSVLTAIYLDARQYDLSIQYAQRALDQYPSNRIFLGELAEAQEQAGKTADAIRTYERLLTSILNAKIANPYSEILCRMHLIEAKLARKETIGVESQVDAILVYEHHVFPDNLKDRAKEKFEKARKIRERLAIQ